MQLHQLTAARIATEVAGQRVVLRVHTSYPWDGTAEIEVVEADGRDWELAVRVPGWARSARVEVAGDVRTVVPGMVRARRNWRPGDRFRLHLDVEPRLTVPDPRVDAVRGTVAVERGPLVYAAEVPGGVAEARHTLPDPRPKLTEVPAGIAGLDPGELPAGHATEVHHPGDSETGVLVLDGVTCWWFGPGLTEHVVAEAGDFVYVPAGAVHVEENPARSWGGTAAAARSARARTAAASGAGASMVKGQPTVTSRVASHSMESSRRASSRQLASSTATTWPGSSPSRPATALTGAPNDTTTRTSGVPQSVRRPAT